MTFLFSFRSFSFLSLTHGRKHLLFIRQKEPVIIYVEGRGGEGKICWKDQNFCIAYKFRKLIDFYKSCLHGEHKGNSHAKYNSFQMIFPQL